jgi:uncharacterized protein
MSQDQTITVTRDDAHHQFEAKLDTSRALLQYRLSGNSIVFTHTEVPEEFEGRGVGAALARAGLDYAREHHLSVVPLCPFVDQYLRRHPADLELVDPKYRAHMGV